MFRSVSVRFTREQDQYDAEVFMALHGGEPYLGTVGADEVALDVICRSFSVSSHSLDCGDPIQVTEGQKVIFRILNARTSGDRPLAPPPFRSRYPLRPVQGGNTVRATVSGPCLRRALRADRVLSCADSPGTKIRHRCPPRRAPAQRPANVASRIAVSRCLQREFCSTSLMGICQHSVSE